MDANQRHGRRHGAVLDALADARYWAAANSLPGLVSTTAHAWVPDSFDLDAWPELELEAQVNGETRQRAALSSLGQTPRQLLARVLDHAGPLAPGSLILTGRPPRPTRSTWASYASGPDCYRRRRPMRKLSQYDDPRHADRLVDTLLVITIDSEVRGEAPWEVWVHDDGQMDDAREALTRFDPSASPRASRKAEHIRERREQDNARASRRSVEVGKRWRSDDAGLGPVTIFLIAVSVLVAYNAGFDNSLGSELVQSLSIEPWLSTTFLSKVRAGEVWRLVTPMWIHFGLIHIGFNLMWLWRLGQDIEARHGSLVMVGLVLFAQVPSGLGQYLASGPSFGGMSGVVYGLFGFVWMQSRYDRSRGYVLGDDVVVIMMIWFVLCLTGVVGPIANVGHAGGLIAGLLAGAPAYLRYRRAHDEAAVFGAGGWADTQLRGGRRFVRRFVTPYAPLWFLALAALGIVVDFWPR